MKLLLKNRRRFVGIVHFAFDFLAKNDAGPSSKVIIQTIKSFLFKKSVILSNVVQGFQIFFPRVIDGTAVPAACFLKAVEKANLSLDSLSKVILSATGLVKVRCSGLEFQKSLLQQL